MFLFENSFIILYSAYGKDDIGKVSVGIHKIEKQGSGWSSWITSIVVQFVFKAVHESLIPNSIPNVISLLEFRTFRKIILRMGNRKTV